MTFDLARILQSKHEFRQCLAARPIAEKLAMLDALLERTLMVRPARPASEWSAPLEERTSRRMQGDKQNHDETRRTVVSRIWWPCASIPAQETDRDFERAVTETERLEHLDNETANRFFAKAPRAVAKDFDSG